MSRIFKSLQRSAGVSPEHLDLLWRIALALGLAGLDRPDGVGLWSVLEGEVWPEGKKLTWGSPRTRTTTGLGTRSPRSVLSLGWSGFRLRLFETFSSEEEIKNVTIYFLCHQNNQAFRKTIINNHKEKHVLFFYIFFVDIGKRTNSLRQQDQASS